MAEFMTGEKELLRALGALRGANRKAAAAAMKLRPPSMSAIALRKCEAFGLRKNGSSSCSRTNCGSPRVETASAKM